MIISRENGMYTLLCNIKWVKKWTCKKKHTNTHAHVYTNTHTCTHTHTHICTHAHVHTHTRQY